MEPAPAAAEPTGGGEDEGDQDDLDAGDYVPGADAGMEEDDAAAAAEGVDGDAGEEGKKKKRGRRKDASDLNLLQDPQDVVVELTADVLEELSGHKKLHQLRYPTYIVCTHKNFQLRAIEGLAAVKGTALKELDLSHNKIGVAAAKSLVTEALATEAYPSAGGYTQHDQESHGRLIRPSNDFRSTYVAL